MNNAEIRSAYSRVIDGQRLIGILDQGRKVAEGWSSDIRPTRVDDLNAQFDSASRPARAAANMIFRSLFHPVTTPAAQASVNRGALVYASNTELDDKAFMAEATAGAKLAEQVLQARGFPAELAVSFSAGLVEGSLNAHVKVVPRTGC